MSEYRSAWSESITRPEEFWGRQSQMVDWMRPPETVLDRSRPPFYRWFDGGSLNTCYNALDRHVAAGQGDRTALIYDSPVTATTKSLTYSALLADVAAFGRALVQLGVERGDRVIIYMPMIPEAVVAMLACARIGAVHSVVFGGFAARELAARIDDAEPKVIVCASCGIEPTRTVDYKPILNEALALSAHRPSACVVKQRPEQLAELDASLDVDWDEAIVEGARDPVGCTEVLATDPLYILHTSGTSGKPKGVVRDNGAHAVAMAWSLPQIYDIHPGQVWWAASDIGWVVGHSYIVYSPLINGATTVLYEGKPVGTPDAGAFWRVIDEHKVQALFTAPTAIRAIKKEDPEGRFLERHDISSLRTVFLAGERLDPDTFEWASDMLRLPIVDHYWQTETGWPVAANLRGLEPMPLKAGSPTVPVPGYEIDILDEQGVKVSPMTQGAICIRLPLPPGALLTLWRDDDRYVAEYLTAHDGYYTSGDMGYFDDDGYLYVLGRTDDVINVAGHRLATGVMEAAIASHPAVAECAVIGVEDSLKGQRPRGFVVLKAGLTVDEDTVARELANVVRNEIGPVAAFKDVVFVNGLPKTRSGKILRKTMREIADGRDPGIPATIEDPAVLERLRPTLRGA